MSTLPEWPPPTHDSLKAKAARALAGGQSYCGRCGMPWGSVEAHTTWYRENHGCFPLCEGCWTLLGHPEARIEYYATMLAVWEQDRPVKPETRQAIGRAVAEGG